MLSLPSTTIRCWRRSAPRSMQSAFLDFHLENESVKYRSRYPTRKRDNNLPNRNQFLKVCVEIQFISFHAADGNTPHLHFIFSHCISKKIHLKKFPSSSHGDRLTFFSSRFLHFLMHGYNRAALRGCESLPEPRVGGLFFFFLSELHSAAAFNIHHFFSLM